MKWFYRVYAYLLGWPVFKKFHKALYKVSLRGLGVYNHENALLSGEKWVLDNVVKKLGDDLVIFDVGANIGSYTTSILESDIKAKKIYTFEPHPITFEELKKNTNGIKGVTLVQEALGDKIGIVNFYDRSDEIGSSHASIFKDIFKEVHGVEYTERSVRAVTIDFFATEENISMIDFLKIDVEGNEYRVLLGAKDYIKESRIRVIQFEFTQLNAIVGVFYKQIYDLLKEKYYLYRLLPHGLLPMEGYYPSSCEIFGYQNYIAILKSSER